MRPLSAFRLISLHAPYKVRPYSTIKSSDLNGFHLERKQSFPCFNITAHLLHHRKSGAEYLHLATDDPNKVFAIAFRTNPPDATGVPHILEHTTLCGSKMYPVQDPFFKMLPRSLHTFMNAMTSPDHTTYPFATPNKQDFKNLLSVYMDATLNPLLRENDFQQEGWRLGPSGNEVAFKGVVYNEMKGVSDPSSLYIQTWLHHIIPDLNDSGGNPREITNLSHAQLKAFHEKNYHPSNAKIFTYSSMPLEEHTLQLSKHLDAFTKIESDNTIISPIELSENRNIVVKGLVDPTSPVDEQYRTSISWITEVDQIDKFSLGIVSRLLLDGYGAPMYRSLIESGLGKDFTPITGSNDFEKKTVFSIGVTGAKEENLAKINEAISNTLSEECQKGFEKIKVDGMLHQMDLVVKHKSAGFGRAHMDMIIPNWMNGYSPFESLDWQNLVESFKERYSSPRYLENLVQKHYIDSKILTLTMKPDEYLAQTFVDNEQQRLKEKIDTLYPNMSKEEVYKSLVSEEEKFNKNQSTPQDLSCLPTLSVKDIPRQSSEKNLEYSSLGKNQVQWHVTPTNGITYIKMINVLDIPEGLLPFMPLFTSCLMRLGTKNQTISEIEDEIQAKTGGVSVSYHSATSPNNLIKWEQGFSVSARAFDQNVPDVYRLIRTLTAETDFDSETAKPKILELLLSSSSSAVDSINYNGHSYARNYVMSGFTPHQLSTEKQHGLSQFYSQMDILSKKETAIPDAIEKLKQIQKHVLSCEIRAAITCGAESRPKNEKNLSEFSSNLPKSSLLPNFPSSDGLQLNHTKAYMSMPFQVSFVALALPGLEYTNPSSAAMSILAQLISQLYLHPEIREKGGAYGSSASSHGSSGVFTMSSYRDPLPERSIEMMKAAGDWAVLYNFTDSDLQEAKLSIFKGLDAPVDINQHGLMQFYGGVNPEMRQQRREQLLDVTVEQVKEVAEKYLVQEMKNARMMIIGPSKPVANDWVQLSPPSMPS